MDGLLIDIPAYDKKPSLMCPDNLTRKEVAAVAA